MKLYVIRHGETNENIGKIMQGNMNTQLNEKGIEQACAARDKLKNVHIDIIFSSPKDRALDTAKIISDGKIKIICDDNLRSRNHGEFEGVDRRKINLYEYWNYNLNKMYEKAENVRDLYNRVSSFLEMLKKNYSDKTVLIATHSGICRIIYYYFNGIPSDGDMTGYEAANCRIEEYEL